MAGTWGRNPWARLMCTQGSPAGKWELIVVSLRQMSVEQIQDKWMCQIQHLQILAEQSDIFCLEYACNVAKKDCCSCS